MRGRPMKGLFDVCHTEKNKFCPQSSTTNNISSSWGQLAASSFDAVKETLSNYWQQPAEPLTNASECVNFNLNSLTVGQVASASSAAAGGGAVETWVRNAIMLARKKTRDIPMRCTVLPMLLQKVLAPCNLAAVTEETMKFLGCKTLSIWENLFPSVETRNSAIIAKKWSAFLQKMAISMTVDTPLGKHDGHMTIDAVGSTSCVRIPTQSPVIHTYTHFIDSKRPPHVSLPLSSRAGAQRQ